MTLWITTISTRSNTYHWTTFVEHIATNHWTIGSVHLNLTTSTCFTYCRPTLMQLTQANRDQFTVLCPITITSQWTSLHHVLTICNTFTHLSQANKTRILPNNTYCTKTPGIYMHTLFRYIHIHLHTYASHTTSVYVKCKQSTQITTGNWVRSRNRKPQRNDDDNGVLASKPRPRPVRDEGRRRCRHQQCRPLTTAGRRQGSTISPYTGTTANHSQTNRADGYGPRAGEQAMTSLPLTVVLAAGGLAEAWRACLAGQRRAGCCFRALGWRCAPAAFWCADASLPPPPALLSSGNSLPGPAHAHTTHTQLSIPASFYPPQVHNSKSRYACTPQASRESGPWPRVRREEEEI